MKYLLTLALLVGFFYEVYRIGYDNGLEKGWLAAAKKEEWLKSRVKGADTIYNAIFIDEAKHLTQYSHDSISWANCDTLPTSIIEPTRAKPIITGGSIAKHDDSEWALKSGQVQEIMFDSATMNVVKDLYRVKWGKPWKNCNKKAILLRWLMLE